MKSFAIFSAGLLAVAIADAPVSAQGFYQGKQITMVVGDGNQGTYAAYARILAKNLSRHIPGKPNILVQIKELPPIRDSG